MTPLRAHHVGITVSDLDRCGAFYREDLGFESLDRFTVSGEAFARVVDVENVSARFVHLDAEGIRLELVEYDPTGDSRVDAELHRSGTTHLCFSVEDLDEYVEALPASVTIRAGPVTTESGSRLCFLQDPEGNSIELLER